MSQGDPFDPATARALDRFTVPPLPPGFAERVVASALARGEVDALPPPVAPRNPSRRGGWVRGRHILIGVTAFSLMSAAAAATGMFGDAVKNVPLIGPLIASVAPAPKPKALAKPKPAAVAATAPAAALPEPETAPTDAAPPLIDDRLPPPIRRQIRREIVAQRLADRIERAEELGIRPTPEQRARMAERLSRMPPAQRAALIRRVREIRRDRREQSSAADLPPSIQPPSAEDRQRFREEWRRLREERRQRRLQSQSDRADEAPVPAQLPVPDPPAPSPDGN